MFPDSDLAKKCSCSETKSMYLCNYALAPSFNKLLLQKVERSQGCVILFGEALNEGFQKKQLDFHIRIWDIGKMVTRYFSSHFLGKSKAVDLCSCFEELTVNFQFQWMGPISIWVTFNKLQDHMKDCHGKGLLNIG